MRTAPAAPVTLEQHVQWWRDAGLITPDQAAAIIDQEDRWSRDAAPVPTQSSTIPAMRRMPSVVEALGYIGGVLSLVGVGLLLSRYWTDMSFGVRVGLGVGVALGLMVAGALVHEDTEPALQRLRWTLWLLSSAAAGFTAAFVMIDGVGSDEARDVAFVVAAVVALQNGVLWADRVRPVQQALFLTALPVAAGTAASQVVSTSGAGVVVALVGAVILWAGLSGHTVMPAITDGIGAAALVVGAAMGVDSWMGPALLVTVATAAFLLALALSPRVVDDESERVVLTSVAAIGLLQTLPQALAWFSNEAGLMTGFVVVAIGVTVLATAQRRQVRAPVVMMLIGGLAIVGGVALTGRQSVAVATTVGLGAAITLLVLGTRRGWAVLSLFGAIGLLVNVPWAIWWFFPGEDRAPLLTTVSGALIIVVAVLLSRMRGRIRDELGGQDQTVAVSAAGGTTSPGRPARA